ncbi:ABC transporter family substrate-binding protein [Falsarthrobacter nasiphocae]|uniref:Peptide/nickel transport system substrate-binding protein n=1 Tax=Falsarthrobacter nasiphocae TaxID=189863 RepID=A0AAE3YI58_9MICC|nr:ABC transporter family substrate-binding protein [Falsarthrobacter nasiphocae]MDR6892466.1 peptide/nickel transport system substrate-binding protein [Falsarthrobacter nasiphocae]
MTIKGNRPRASRTMMVSTVAVLSSLVLAGCGGASGEKKGPAAGKEGSTKIDENPQPVEKLEKGGTLQLSVGGLGPDFNRFSANGNTVDLSTINGPMNNASLWESEADGKPVPKKDYLLDAKSEVKGGKQVITYTLNPKATRNDGTPIDWKTLKNQAEVFSGKNKDYALVTTAGYEDIEKVERGKDDRQAIVTMKKEFYPWEDLFTGLMHPAINTPDIFNKGFAKPRPEWMAGPFKLEKYDSSAKIISMVPNEKWWGNKPLLDKVIFRAMESQATIPAFKNGELDAVGIATFSRYQQASGTPNSEERRGQRLSTIGMVFNAKADSPVKDLKVRKAIWQATDPAPLREVRFKGLNWDETRPGSWMSMPFSPYYEDNLPVKFSREDASKTLEEAGWKKGSDGIFAKDGKKLTVSLTTFGDDTTGAAQAQTYQKQLKEAGIDLKIDNKASSQFQETIAKRQYEIVFLSYTVGSDPTSVPKQYYHSKGENLSGTGTPEIDKMIDGAKPTDDAKERAKAANAAEKKAMEQYGMLPLFNGPTIGLYRKGLANFGPSLYKTRDWTKVGFEKGSTHK